MQKKKKKDLCSVWRICCDWLNMSNVAYKVSWWRFLAGQWWSIDDWARSMVIELGPWSSRPVEIDSDQTETPIENNQCYTLQEKDDILKISKLSIENYLRQLGYVNHFDAWISNKLSKTKQNKKALLDHILHVILHLNINENALFKKSTVLYVRRCCREKKIYHWFATHTHKILKIFWSV